MTHLRAIAATIALIAGPAAAWNEQQVHVIVNLADAVATSELCGEFELNVDLATVALTAWGMDAGAAMADIIPLAQNRMDELDASGTRADSCRMASLLFGEDGLVVSGLVLPLAPTS